MRIALCDDELLQIENLIKKLKDYKTLSGEQLEIDIFGTAFTLLDSLKKKKYDVVLMDIIMPGLTGIEAAKEIRKEDKKIQIIFLTTSPEYAVDSYRVEAFDYLLKPVDTKLLYADLDRVYELRREQMEESLTIETPKEVFLIALNKLEYVEIVNRVLLFHLLDGSVRQVSGKLSDYEERLLKRCNFLKVHRSFIINMDLMASYNRKNFIAKTGEEIPISRNMIKEVQDNYITYLHKMYASKE